MKELKIKTMYCGIDVSKLSFDIYYQEKSHVYKNSIKGFKAFSQVINKNDQ